MDNCLNILERPEVFIPAAALIVIVLLVWAQLSARGNLDEDFNLVLGIVWTYLAMVFALIAVSVFIYGKMNLCAKGFLVLSFLMTLFNISLAIVLIIIKIIKKLPFSESLTKVGEDFRLRRKWILFWILLLASCGVVSFSLAFGCSYWWIWIIVVLGDFAYACFIIKKTRNARNKDINERVLIRNLREIK